MNGRWAALIALGCAVTALVVFLRSGQSEPGLQAPATRLHHASETQHRSVVPPSLGGNAPKRRLSLPGGSDSDGGSGRDRTAGNPPQERDAGRNGQAADAWRQDGRVQGDAEQDAEGALPNGTGQRGNAPLAHHDLPSRQAAGAAPGDGADEQTDDGRADVAYDSGGRTFNTSSQVEITDAGTINGAGGTIAFWIDPQWSSEGAQNASLVQLGDHGLQLVKDGDVLRFQYTDASGEVRGGSADISGWQPGEWQHVAATWNGSSLALYLNGAQQFLDTPPGAPQMPFDKLVVGSAINNTGIAPAELSYLTVLNHPVSPDELTQLFGSGARPK